MERTDFWRGLWRLADPRVTLASASSLLIGAAAAADAGALDARWLLATAAGVAPEDQGAYEQALATLSQGAPEGRLTVSVGSDHAWYFAPRIRTFFDRYPSVALSLRVYKSADAIVALDKGEIDVSFGIFPTLPKRLERQAIEESTLSIAYNPRELGLRRRPPGPADLTHQRVMVPPRSTITRQLIEEHLAPALARAQTVIEAPTCETAATFVEMGVGMALVHTLCMERHRSPDVRSVDLGPRYGKVAFCAVYRRGALRKPLVRALVDELSNPATRLAPRSAR